jgi:hypothetical protein
MTDALGGVSQVGVEAVTQRDLVVFDAMQSRVAPFAPGSGDGVPVHGMFARLTDHLQATSELYRRALVQAVDPLGSQMFGGTLAGESNAVTAKVAPIGVEQPIAEQSLNARFGLETPLAGGSVQEIGPLGERHSAPGVDGQSFRPMSGAVEESLDLMMQAHSEIMRRQLGIMSATTAVEAATSGARSSGQNIDTLLRGG